MSREFFHMMTSSTGNILRVTGHLRGEFTGHRWIPRTKASDAEFWFFSLICAWINGWVNNREAGDLKRHRPHYDVIVMIEIFVIYASVTKLHFVFFQYRIVKPVIDHDKMDATWKKHLWKISNNVIGLFFQMHVNMVLYTEKVASIPRHCFNFKVYLLTIISFLWRQA